MSWSKNVKAAAAWLAMRHDHGVPWESVGVPAAPEPPAALEKLGRELREREEVELGYTKDHPNPDWENYVDEEGYA